MGNQDVNDYYPGGAKNPLDPIMYKDFLDMVNTQGKKGSKKLKKKKQKEKSKENPQQPILRLEHSHTELSLK